MINRTVQICLGFLIITGCSGRLYTTDISASELESGSDHLREHFHWDPLMAREKFLLQSGGSEQSHLFKLYSNHDFQPLWLNKGSLTQNSRDLIRCLRSSWKDGLSPESYRLGDIHRYLAELDGVKRMNSRTMKKIIQLDLLFTEAFLNYSADLLSGKVNPNNLDSIWEAHPRQADLVSGMELAIYSNTVCETLDQIKPLNSQYRKLSAKLSHYLELEETKEWYLPGKLPFLERGDSSEHVVKIKKFLLQTGDLVKDDRQYLNSPYFDSELKKSVASYQRRHGLEVDGLVGKNTLYAMNVALEDRIDQLKVNLERLRWLPHDFGKDYILLNLPEYRLRYYKNDELAMEMKIVIGEVENYTPVLKDTLRYIVFNPTWNVPNSISTEEILPKIKADSNYLEKNRYILLRNSYLSEDTVHADSVNWEEIDRENFPYYLVKVPGETNPLGRVKFLFPNQHAIYLHDTPADHLFTHRERNFSHGCIRLEKPLELSSAILQNQLPREDISEILESGETETIVVRDEVIIHFLYQTSWVDQFDKLHFRDDLYNYDHLISERL